MIALAAVALPALLAGLPPSRPQTSVAPDVAVQPSARPSTAAGSAGSGSGAGSGAGSGSGSGGGVRPGRPRPTAHPVATGAPSTASPSAEPAPIVTPPPQLPSTDAPGTLAPTQPADFDLRRQQIDIAFPFRADSDYAYRNNFLDPRDGAPETYNHGRVDGAGEVMRLHDGIDIYAELGEPLVAPFSGTVIDPAERWQSWVPERYGRTVVIVSDEPNTAGYIALLSHMDRLWVEIGQNVTRGQVLGTVGRTGNAEEQSVRPHVHFELRAPFLLDWILLGHDRVLDAFNPYQSLVAADPRRNR